MAIEPEKRMPKTPTYPNRAQRLALHTIVNHYMVEVRLRKKEMYDMIGGHKADFNNFLNAAGEKGSDLILEAMRKQVHSKRYYEAAPPHIRTAIRECFGVLEDETPEYREYSTILSALALNDEALLTRLSRNYEGIWHVFRYSAHVEPGAEVVDTMPDGSKDAWVVRAGMQVFERDPLIGRQLPTFRILYRPSRAVRKGHVFKTEGVVVPIGRGDICNSLDLNLTADTC